MSHELYFNYAELYGLIADDRNFIEELNRLRAFTLPSTGLFVELFAGPAYHGTHLLNGGWNGKVVAIDNSPEMEKVACNRGFNGNYLCADAIIGLEQIVNADLIFIPRYSIVLVDKEYAANLFNQAAKSLDTNGVFFVEIHKDANIENQLYIGGRWDELSIHKRILETPLGKIECIWPYKTEIVDSDKKIVDMDVKITIAKDNLFDEYVFTSREHLHTKADILKFADEAGLKELRERSCELVDSYLLAFGLKECDTKTNSPILADTFQSDILEKLSFNRLFDISSVDACSVQLKKSGLDADAHDSPLSLHVYNLL